MQEGHHHIRGENSHGVWLPIPSLCFSFSLSLCLRLPACLPLCVCVLCVCVCVCVKYLSVLPPRSASQPAFLESRWKDRNAGTWKQKKKTKKRRREEEKKRKEEEEKKRKKELVELMTWWVFPQQKWTDAFVILLILPLSVHSFLFFITLFFVSKKQTKKLWKCPWNGETFKLSHVRVRACARVCRWWWWGINLYQYVFD